MDGVGDYEILPPSEVRPADRPGIEVGADGDRMRIIVWGPWRPEPEILALATGTVAISGQPADRELVADAMRRLIQQADAAVATADRGSFVALTDAGHAVGDWRERTA